MKILLISGHGAGDCGALGNGFQEADLTREIVSLIALKLKQYAEVDIYDQARNAYKDVMAKKMAVDFRNYNYVFEVHLNAFNTTAKGTEIFVTREEPRVTVEEKIMQELSKFFTVRGVKRKNFSVITKARKKGVSSALLEVFFIDNAEDMATYQNNKDGVITAIVNGIVNGFGLAQKKIEQPVVEQKQPERKTNEQIADEIIKKPNYGGWGKGQERKDKLTAAGYDYAAIQKIINKKLK
jgi:N-acetylmuramoyl-L-alanine amidase